MNTNMILSASGWRKVFAISGQEQDRTTLIGEQNIAISIYASIVFADYVLHKTQKSRPVILLGMDARPTGPTIAEACIKAFLTKDVELKFIGVTAAPEIMAFSRETDGFMYISASHNPIGHNGIKFGLNDGGVLNGTENAFLVEKFNSLCTQEEAEKKAFDLIHDVKEESIAKIYKECKNVKDQALKSYHNFLKWTITASEDKKEQDNIFNILKEGIKNRKIGVVCDMNGSARADSVDKAFFNENGINFYAINDKAGQIVHEIIPESENLVHVASYMEQLQKEGKTDAILGYMPDCDGDRGNIVYWDAEQKKAIILKAQEVFSLSVLAELTYSQWINQNNPDFKSAVCVNCPTSMRINEISQKLNTSIFRAEVGEANVVNLARKKRDEGYNVRIFGEGSNGGTITYPSAVRDPLNTIFAIIKFLCIKDLYQLWCTKSNNTYNQEYTLTDVLKTIPVYTTTGVSEPRAILKINTKDHSELKRKFQKIFEAEWPRKQKILNNYGIYSYTAITTNGTQQIPDITDYGISGKGGLKILFLDKKRNPDSFIWMRGSGTEPVFRIMCDVCGDNPQKEHYLLDWLTTMLKESDK